MTPKEKCDSLIQRFNPYVYFQWDEDELKEVNIQRLYSAKHCALICVNEIIREYESQENAGQFMYDMDAVMTFWDNVKKEIEKL